MIELQMPNHEEMLIELCYQISFNKASKQKAMVVGPYVEMFVTSAEEQIIFAAGICSDVEGLSSVKRYGKPKLSRLRRKIS